MPRRSPVVDIMIPSSVNSGGMNTGCPFIYFYLMSELNINVYLECNQRTMDLWSH